MKKIVSNNLTKLFTTYILTFGVVCIGTAQDETFNIDRSHSVIAFSIGIAGGFSEVDGSFNDFKGNVIVEAGTYKLKSATIEIQATSINTGVEGRDRHLRTDDFFDVENYPTITFKSVNVIQNATDIKVDGDFTMHGITKRITIPFTRSHEQRMVWIFGDPNIIYEGTIKLSREEYGIKASGRWGSLVEATGEMAMSDEVTIRLKIITKGESPVRALASAVSQNGRDGFLTTYARLEKKYEGIEIFNEGTYGSVARRLRRQKKNEAIVEVYKIWVENYPESSDAHLNLGQSYLTTEDTDQAKKSFKKSLKLDPENEAAKEELAKLD